MAKLTLPRPRDSLRRGAIGRILVYHRIDRSLLLRQLAIVREKFDIISLTEAVDRLRNSSQCRNARPFAVVTLDDGFRDILLVCDDLLREGTQPCLYVAKCFIGRPEFLRTEELKSLADRFDIGSHTISHPCLLQLPPEKLTEELDHSKQWLEDLTGRPIVHFAAPFGGQSTFDRAAIRVAADVGYQTFRTTFRGWNQPPRHQRETGIKILKADPVYDQWPAWRLRLTLDGFLDWKHELHLRRALTQDSR